MSTDGTILVVDDEKLNILALGKILSQDYRLIVAKSGEEAVAAAIKNTPDLILLDVMMPDMSGFDVLAKLSVIGETKSIPVIFVTGLIDATDEERGLELGAVDYITKPFSGAVVKARVRTQMRLLRTIREVERLSMFDSLTNIANRRNFTERFKVEWHRAEREELELSFAMCDVDKFKNYNDTYGHPQGDVLLKTVANVFVKHCRRAPDLPARLGGEEFGLLFPNTKHENACIIAEQIRDDIEHTVIMTSEGKPTSVTLSMGVGTVMPVRGEIDMDRFLIMCDEMLYRAKNTGRNRIVSSVIRNGGFVTDFGGFADDKK